MTPKPYGRLAGRLHELGITQGDLGYALKISHTAVSNRMAGKTPWTVDEMYQVLTICRAQPEELHIYFPPLPPRKAGGVMSQRSEKLRRRVEGLERDVAGLQAAWAGEDRFQQALRSVQAHTTVEEAGSAGRYPTGRGRRSRPPARGR